MDLPNQPNKPASDTAGRFTQRSAAEWVTFIAASFILLGLVGLIFFDWQTNQNRPPAFSVAVSEAVRVTDGRYYVPFAITNTGGRIARMVQVTAELHITGVDDETGEQQIDFLSGHETKAGSFVFTHNPQGGGFDGAGGQLSATVECGGEGRWHWVIPKA